nr:N-acetylmuramoyl-L-alanine amidase [Thermoactinomyces sp. DSM 45891]
MPSSNRRNRPQTKRTPKYITIHETDNTRRGANAKAHANLQYRGNDRTASWHYSVDENEIWQSVPDNEIAWACTDGANGTGNRFSISIEICVNADGNFSKAQENAKELVRHLMKKWSIPLSNVVPHSRWTKKNCPRNILRNWDSWVRSIGSSSTVSTSSTSSSQPSYMDTNFSRNMRLRSPMMRGNDVKRVQHKIGAKVDGIFGRETRAKVIAYQKARKLAADGIVGVKTWRSMFW